jgi:nucleotide-binding universal stress UspA family protein
MRIMVGVDTSTAGGHALRWALQVAARCGGGVTAVRTWAYPPSLLRDLPSPEAMDVRVAAELAATVERARSETEVTAPVDQVVTRGPAQHALLQQAQSTSPDLVVVGRRGSDERSAPRVLGSASRRLVDASPAPTVVISKDPGTLADRPLIMVATDGSPDAERATAWAVGFARATGGRILLAHVVGLVGTPEQVAPMAEKAAAFLEEAASRVRHVGVTCATATAYGDPRSGLDRIADDDRPDLIVAGPRGAGKLTKLVLGTVANHLAQYSDHPVVVVPSTWTPERAPA